MLSTLVTLMIVPVFYVLFDRFGAWVMKLAKREEHENYTSTFAELDGSNGKPRSKSIS